MSCHASQKDMHRGVGLAVSFGNQMPVAHGPFINHTGLRSELFASDSGAHLHGVQQCMYCCVWRQLAATTAELPPTALGGTDESPLHVEWASELPVISFVLLRRMIAAESEMDGVMLVRAEGSTSDDSPNALTSSRLHELIAAVYRRKQP